MNVKAKGAAVTRTFVPLRSETSARPNHGRLIGVIQRFEVEVELINDEVTLQQEQAYKQFWQLILERLVNNSKVTGRD